MGCFHLLRRGLRGANVSGGFAKGSLEFVGAYLQSCLILSHSCHHSARVIRRRLVFERLCRSGRSDLLRRGGQGGRRRRYV